MTIDFSIYPKVPVIFQGYLDPQDKLNVLKFADAKANIPGQTHKEIRDGGSAPRKSGEIYRHILEGKTAEIPVRKYLMKVKPNFHINDVDFNIYKESNSDMGDLQWGKYQIEVKSASHRANFLLLESKTYQLDGTNKYLHKKADFIFFVRVWLNVCTQYKDLKKCSNEEIQKYNLEYQICGFLTADDFEKIIIPRKELPKGFMLTRNTKLDAPNYWAHISELKHL